MKIEELDTDSYLRTEKRHCKACRLLPPEEECGECTDRRMYLVTKHGIPRKKWELLLKALRHRKEHSIQKLR